MTIAKDFASKLAVAFVAVAMIFAAIAPGVQAQETSEDLQKTINDLLAQVASLQGELGDKGAAPAMGSCNFMMDLKTGSTGPDVKALQMFLNSDPDTRVAATGVGSAGMETEYYGPATGAAVSKFQVKYRAEILSPAGLVNPTGYFGPGSRAQANKLCAGSDDGDDSDDDSDDSDDSDDGELSGEGTLDTFEMDDASDDEAEEGAEDTEIAEITVEAVDGDIEVDRMTFTIVGQSTPTEDEPWEVFDTITLWVDGDMIGEFDASDEDAYLDEDDGEFRFSGLDLVLNEDEEVDITVAASVQGDVDGAGTDADWRLTATEVRFFDADGVADDDATTDELPTAQADFSIVAEGEGDELTVKSSSEDPDATTLQLEDDETSEFMTIFAFELDASDSDGDVEVSGLTVDVDATEDGTTATSTIFLINDAQLVIDGETYDDVTITNGTTGNYLFDFEDEVVIDAEGSVTVEFQVEFEALDADFEGATVQASVDGGDVDAEGGDDITVEGSSTGDEHTLRTEGAILEVTEMSETIKENTDGSTTDDEGVFEIEFEVTAFENDLYIDDTATRGTAESNTGLNFQLLVGGTATTAGTAVATVDSDAELDGARYLVSEGETETFTLTVEFDPNITGSYKLQLYSVNFNDTNADADTQQLALPEEDYETDSLTI